MGFKQWIYGIIILCLLLGGCDTSSGDVLDGQNDVLTVSLEMPETPETVPSYYLAERMYVNEEALLAYFFQGEDPVKDDFQRIEGEAYYCSQDGGWQEFLLVRNGMITSGLPGAYYHYGGFRYSQYMDGGYRLPYATYHLFSNIVTEKSIIETYSKELELDFQSRENVQAEIRTFLDAIGLNQAKVDQCYSMDVETMQELADAYIRKEERVIQNADVVDPERKAPEPYTFTQEEEAYYLTYAQEVDGNRFCNLDLGLGMRCPSGYVLYTQEGIVEADFGQFVQITEEGEATEVVSPQECLDAYLNEFHQNLEPVPTELTMMGLYYVPTELEEAEEQEYIPVWVLEIRQVGEDTLGDEMIEYRYRVWNAVTGEGMTNMR